MNQAAREIRERTSRHEAMTEDEVRMNQIAGKERERPSMGEAMQPAEMGTITGEHAKRCMNDGRHQTSRG